MPSMRSCDSWNCLLPGSWSGQSGVWGAGRGVGGCKQQLRGKSCSEISEAGRKSSLGNGLGINARGKTQGLAPKEGTARARLVGTECPSPDEEDPAAPTMGPGGEHEPPDTTLDISHRTWRGWAAPGAASPGCTHPPFPGSPQLLLTAPLPCALATGHRGIPEPPRWVPGGPLWYLPCAGPLSSSCGSVRASWLRLRGRASSARRSSTALPIFTAS